MNMPVSGCCGPAASVHEKRKTSNPFRKMAFPRPDQLLCSSRHPFDLFSKLEMDTAVVLQCERHCPRVAGRSGVCPHFRIDQKIYRFRRKTRRACQAMGKVNKQVNKHFSIGRPPSVDNRLQSIISNITRWAFLSRRLVCYFGRRISGQTTKADRPGWPAIHFMDTAVWQARVERRQIISSRRHIRIH